MGTPKTEPDARPDIEAEEKAADPNIIESAGNAVKNGVNALGNMFGIDGRADIQQEERCGPGNRCGQPTK